MRILDLFLAVLFLTMAILQFNDPDPVYWIAVYGGTALLVLGRAFARFSEFWAAVTIGGVVAGIINAVPGGFNFFQHGELGDIFGSMRAGKPYVESMREFGGLLMSFAVLVIYVLRCPHRSQISDPQA